MSADELVARLRACHGIIDGDPDCNCAEAADQLERDEEHYQAAMRMSEKHRKNLVEACQGGAKERETLAWLAKHATFDDMPADLYNVMNAALKEPR